MAAHVLVLLASGCLYYDPGRLRNHLRSAANFRAKADLWLQLIAFSSMAIALLGFMVWAHHMFTSGLAPFLQLPFMILTYVIGVPDRYQDLLVDGNAIRRQIHYTAAMLFGIGFVGLFTVGGITGIFLAAIPFDLHVHGAFSTSSSGASITS